MDSTSSKAISASCALHFGLSGVLLFFAFKNPSPPETPDQVFELIAAPVAADPTARTVTSPHNAPPLPDNYKPQLVRIKNVPIKFPDPVPDDPAPTPSPNPSTKAPDKPTRDTGKTAPKNNQTSFDEFAKNNPNTSKSSSSSAKPSKPAKPSGGTPQIDPQYYIKGSQNGPRMATPNTGALNIPPDPSEMNLFYSVLKQKIKDNWRKPPSYTTIECDVSFDVAASGTISNVRLIKSSGDHAFDQSAVDALRAVGNAGRPPQGKALVSNIITFNLKDY